MDSWAQSLLCDMKINLNLAKVVSASETALTKIKLNKKIYKIPRLLSTPRRDSTIPQAIP